MRTFLILTTLLAFAAPALAGSTSCTTRKSGSVTITSCSGYKQPSTTRRSYMSGSVRKTTCSS